jgi:hypothetical protein
MPANGAVPPRDQQQRAGEQWQQNVQVKHQSGIPWGKKMVSPVGFEPTAIRLKVECSTG